MTIKFRTVIPYVWKKLLCIFAVYEIQLNVTNRRNESDLSWCSFLYQFVSWSVGFVL